MSSTQEYQRIWRRKARLDPTFKERDRIANQKSRLKHIEARRAHDRAITAANPGVKDRKRRGTPKRIASTAANTERVRQKRKLDRRWAKGTDLRHTYPGFGLEHYELMIQMQNGRCAACGATNFGGRHKILVVDHNHVTKKVRGLLCDPCNKTLGHAQENSQRLEQCAVYLRQHNEK